MNGRRNLWDYQAETAFRLVSRVLEATGVMR